MPWSISFIMLLFIVSALFCSGRRRRRFNADLAGNSRTRKRRRSNADVLTAAAGEIPAGVN